MVERSVWRSVQASTVGKNLSRRGPVWRFRRALPKDLRERAGRAEVFRGLGRVPIGDALAEAERLNLQLDRAVEAALLDPAFDLPAALVGLRSSAPSRVETRRAPEALAEAERSEMVAKYQPAGPQLSHALEHYEREQWAAAEKAGNAAMAELRRFLEHVGDRPVAEVTREHVRRFRDQRGENLRASTLNIKVMSRLVAFFHHCRQEGWVTKLPTTGLRMRDPVPSRDRRRTFTLAELRRVFGPAWRRECGADDHRYHCGLLLLATGARAEEIAQLRVADVNVEGPLVALRITDAHADQRLKNPSSRRLIPLHSVIVPAFRRYLAQIEREGHEWVFPRWSRTPTQPRSAPLVTTFGSYLRNRCGIGDRRVVLHSLRHTVKQLLQEAGAPEPTISDLLGHTMRGETNGTYGEAAPVEHMSEWVERLPLHEVLASAHPTAVSTHPHESSKNLSATPSVTHCSCREISGDLPCAEVNR